MGLAIPKNEIAAFCERWKITELSLFGSVLRDDFGPDSDVDVMVVFAPDAGVSYWDWADMQRELSVIFGGRGIDLLTRSGVEQSRNPWRKHAILGDARTVYAA